jgi:F-type H+-transporting ATPase subunit epsilon
VANTFRCRLVTPAASLLDSEVSYASIPAWDGLMGFLPGRAPILARLGTGELSVETSDKSPKSFFVDGGFVQMNGKTLTVLAERAIPTDQLKAADVQAELKSLEARTIPDSAPNRQAQVEALNKDRERARAMLRVAGK